MCRGEAETPPGMAARSGSGPAEMSRATAPIISVSPSGACARVMRKESGSSHTPPRPYWETNRRTMRS